MTNLHTVTTLVLRSTLCVFVFYAKESTGSEVKVLITVSVVNRFFASPDQLLKTAERYNVEISDKCLIENIKANFWQLEEEIQCSSVPKTAARVPASASQAEIKELDKHKLN